MTELFSTSRTNIIEYINNIYEEKELDKNSTCQNFRQVWKEGNRNVTREILFYNLDMILSYTGEKLLIGAGKISHDKAIEKARTEYKKYQVKTISPVEQEYSNALKEISKEIKKEDKIFCGISAGAITFCKYGVLDSRKTFKYDKYIKVRGLNFFNILFCPSFEEKYNYIENIDRIMKKAKVPMFALEKGTALIVNGNKTRIVKSLENKKVYKIIMQGYKKSIMELTNDNINGI